MPYKSLCLASTKDGNQCGNNANYPADGGDSNVLNRCHLSGHRAQSLDHGVKEKTRRGSRAPSPALSTKSQRSQASSGTARRTSPRTSVRFDDEYYAESGDSDSDSDIEDDRSAHLEDTIRSFSPGAPGAPIAHRKNRKTKATDEPTTRELRLKAQVDLLTIALESLLTEGEAGALAERIKKFKSDF